VKISVIGAAGNIGSSVAFNLASHRVADQIVMIDGFSQDKLEHYVTDLSVATTGMDMDIRAGADEDMKDSDIVVISAGSAQTAGSRLSVLPVNLPIIQKIARNIRRLCPEAIVITASNPVDPLNYAVFMASDLDRKKILGYSYNDSLRFNLFLAQTLGLKSSQVEAMTLGEHGGSGVLLFSSVQVNGKPVGVSEEIKKQVRQQVANLFPVMEAQRVKLGRTHAWTTAIGLTSICQAISQDTGKIIPCSVVLEGEYGCQGISMAVPVSIGREGVREILELDLSSEEKAGLKITVDNLNPAMKYVEGFFKGQEEAALTFAKVKV
jgi:malate dehydrogenase